MLRTQIPGYFKERRDRLMAAHAGAAFLFPANPETLRNPDVHYPYRQESNFYYLCGFDEPESFLLLAPKLEGAGSYRTILFVRKRDRDREIWNGERYGTEGALKVFGVDEAYTFDELEKRLPELVRGSEKVFYRIGMNEACDRRVLAGLETVRITAGRSGRGLLGMHDPLDAVGEMRLYKSAAEAEVLRRACQITASAHRAAMLETKPGMNEFEVEALIDYTIRRQGSQRMGYGSIVAGGKNATCLHYVANNEKLRDGDLLLIDAGGEFDYYTSDITRTFPVGRRFSAKQAEIYDLVLKSQLAACAMAKPGAKLPAIHAQVIEVLTDGLLQLGLLKGKRAELIEGLEFKRYFPHGTSHWLGMDVHDVGLYLKNGEPRVLEAGMCFTIEPGLYVQPFDLDAQEAYRGIGVRIEDDVLITAEGCDILTRDVPKDRGEIEALREKAMA